MEGGAGKKVRKDVFGKAIWKPATSQPSGPEVMITD